MSTVDPEHREEEDALAAADDEDTGAPVAPMVKLVEEIEAYRFDKERSQWKERRWYRQVSEASAPTISFCQICPRGRMLKICILLLLTPLALLSLPSPCMTNQQTSTVSMLDYSQGFSATYFEVLGLFLSFFYT